MGAFVGATMGWIAVGLFTSGDYIGNGAILAIPAVVAMGGGGAGLSAKISSRWFRLALLVGVVVCLAFWLAVPNGWWAVAPPRHGGGAR